MSAHAFTIGQSVIVSGHSPAPTRKDSFGKTQPLRCGVVREVHARPARLSVHFEYCHAETLVAPEEIEVCG